MFGGYCGGKIPPPFAPFSVKFGAVDSDARAATEVVEAVEAEEGKRWYDSCIGRLDNP